MVRPTPADAPIDEPGDSDASIEYWFDAPDSDDCSAALGRLRKARRGNRLKGLSMFDALYRAYTIGLGGSVIALLLVNVIDDKTLSARSLADVQARGGAFAGLAIALLVAVGVRSGSRGGPLALEAPDVRHVLLAPVDRTTALRPAAIRQLRTAAFVGACAGALAGVNAGHRLPRPLPVWAAVDGAVGMVVALSALGAALTVSGNRLGRRVGGLVAVLVLCWSVLDVTQHLHSSPATLLGGLALAPSHFRPIDLAGLAMLVFVPLGLLSVGGTSLEECEHRARLVGVARFAATMQDVRTVLVVRRQLAQERPRARPWLPLLRSGLGKGRASRPGRAAARRSLAGVLHWPVGRVARLVAFAAGAGVATASARSGTTPMAVVAAGCCWLAGLDLVEGLGQEEDHPSRLAAVPRDRGRIHLALLLVPGVVALLLVAVAAAAARIAGAPTGQVWAVALAIGPIAAAGVVLGAAVTTLLGAQNPVSSNAMAATMPEAVGISSAFRAVFPIVVAGAGPLVAAGAAAIQRHDATATVTSAISTLSVPSGIALVLVGAWVRFRTEIGAWFKTNMTMDGLSKAAASEKERAVAEKAERLEAKGGRAELSAPAVAKKRRWSARPGREPAPVAKRPAPPKPQPVRRPAGGGPKAAATRGKNQKRKRR